MLKFDEIQKFQIRNFLKKKLGLRIFKEYFYKFEYDRENYRLLWDKSDIVILDVGANVGQSTLWYLESFPSAQIYAFEPLPNVYKRLQSSLKHHQNVTCIEKAVGRQNGKIQIPYIKSDTVLTTQVLKGSLQRSPDDIDIEVVNLDNFVEEQEIETIDILKTDTEGYDLDVLAGARELLEAGRIVYILSEATTNEEDTQYTSFYKLKSFLEPLGYVLHSFYDVTHRPSDGRIEHFNVLFKLDRK